MQSRGETPSIIELSQVKCKMHAYIIESRYDLSAVSQWVLQYIEVMFEKVRVIILT